MQLNLLGNTKTRQLASVVPGGILPDTAVRHRLGKGAWIELKARDEDSPTAGSEFSATVVATVPPSQRDC